MKVALTGIQATGELHIGNYLGAIKPGLELQEQYSCLFFIADLHSLTTVRDPSALREQSYDIAATWISLGLDTDTHLLYRQSDVPMVTEYAWYLSCFTGMGLLNKSHAYKDKISKGLEANHGLFAYPVLMAADIMMYDADVVPVGKDQKQHVEFARDMAGSVNAVYGDGIVKSPEPLIREEVMLIPGLDGQKMSKSYNNTIPIFAPEKKLRKLVLSLVTDSTALDEPKELNGTTLGQLFKLFATDAEYRELEEKLAAGGYGWGHAKQDLFEAINREVAEARKIFFELKEDRSQIDAILKRGAEKAYEKALPVMNRLRTALGLAQFPSQIFATK